MTGHERRAQILKLLSESGGPITGTALANQFSVSRQVIVQDIALLRAGNHSIIATTNGYMIMKNGI